MSQVDDKELNRMLQQAFDASTKLYQERGFQRRVGSVAAIQVHGWNRSPFV